MKKDTALLHLARDVTRQSRAANMPIIHASTIFFDSLEELEADHQLRSSYGLHGVETHFSLLDNLVALEQGCGGVLVPSGLAAITIALMTFLKPGDELWIPDHCYGPTRRFADGTLMALGVTTHYYAPQASAAKLENMLSDRAKVIFLETPGSDTFEMQDVPAIAAMARQRGVKTIIDNTWSAGYYFQPLTHGVDVSIQAVTKYIAGHSDCLMGLIVCADQQDYQQIYATHKHFGIGMGSAEMAYLAARGLRSMAVRLRQHQENAMIVAEWLQSHPKVVKVLYPALPSDAGHALWKRDFTGATSLFSFTLEKRDHRQLAALCNHLALFGMGYSWGGYESLLLPKSQHKVRSLGYDDTDELLRIHVGLEDPHDLIDDLNAAFTRYYA